MALSISLDVVAAALGQSASTGGELRGNGCVGSNPVGEGILAVLDDGLGGFVAVVCGTGLAWSDRSIVNELQEVLSVACNDGKFLAVFAEGIELVGVSSLQLLACDVRELSLSDQGLGLSADKLLLQNNDLGGVGLLVLKLSNLVGDLLLAYSRD
jgi:hypothetical protein